MTRACEKPGDVPYIKSSHQGLPSPDRQTANAVQLARDKARALSYPVGAPLAFGPSSPVSIPNPEAHVAALAPAKAEAVSSAPPFPAGLGSASSRPQRAVLCSQLNRIPEISCRPGFPNHALSKKGYQLTNSRLLVSEKSTRDKPPRRQQCAAASASNSGGAARCSLSVGRIEEGKEHREWLYCPTAGSLHATSSFHATAQYVEVVC